jgi:hypothetical protein
MRDEAHGVIRVPFIFSNPTGYAKERMRLRSARFSLLSRTKPDRYSLLLPRSTPKHMSR